MVLLPAVLMLARDRILRLPGQLAHWNQAFRHQQGRDISDNRDYSILRLYQAAIECDTLLLRWVIL